MTQPATPSRRADLFEKRLTTYGTMVVATIACAGSADAAPIITYLGPDITANNSRIWFNPATGQAAHSAFTGAEFYLRNRNLSQMGDSGGSIYRRAWGWGLTAYAGFLGPKYVPRLAYSSFIPGGYGFVVQGVIAYYVHQRWLTVETYGSWHRTYLYWDGNWLGGGRGFLGLRFKHLGNLHYGWADITVDPATFAITLHRLAWDNVAEAQIHAGSGTPIPEPASAVLLAMGAAGLAAYRRRKAAKS